MPKVSILMPVYNTENFLSQAIESVINQTFTDWELIILDDRSNDKSFSIAQNFANKDSRIFAYQNEINLGMVGNWNKGIDLCKSEYFVKLDSDDWWDANMLFESITILNKKPEIALIFTRYVKVDMNANVIPGTESILPDFAKDKDFNCIDLVRLGAKAMLQYDVLRQGLSVMRREVFEKIGKYRLLITSETQGSSDTEFYFRLGCHYKIFSLDKVYYYYRVHNNNIAARDSEKEIQEKKIYEIRSVIIDYYFFQQKINKFFYKRFKRDNLFLYNLYLINQSRKRGDYLKAMLKLLANLKINPLATIRFYKQRMQTMI